MSNIMKEARNHQGLDSLPQDQNQEMSSEVTEEVPQLEAHDRLQHQLSQVAVETDCMFENINTLGSSESPRYQRDQDHQNGTNQFKHEALSCDESRLRAQEKRSTHRTLRQQQQQQKKQQNQEELHVNHVTRMNVDHQSDASSIDENYDVLSLPESVKEINNNWRGQIQAVLKSKGFHIVIVFLVVIDVFIVMFELLLDVGTFNNRQCSGRTIIDQAQFCHFQFPGECPPNAVLIIEKRNFSASPGIGVEDLCFCGVRNGLYVCLQADEMSGVSPALVLHIFSLAILSLFVVEVILKMVAFRLKFFTDKFEVFDGIVIIVSWIVDVASITEEEAFQAVALLIALRLWRVLRIVVSTRSVDHNIGKCSSGPSNAPTSKSLYSGTQLRELRAEARKIIHALHKAQDKMDGFKRETIKLKHELHVQSQNHTYIDTNKLKQKLRTNNV